MSETGPGDMSSQFCALVTCQPPRLLLQHMEKSFRPAVSLLFCRALYLKCLLSPSSSLKSMFLPFSFFQNDTECYKSFEPAKLFKYKLKSKCALYNRGYTVTPPTLPYCFLLNSFRNLFVLLSWFYRLRIYQLVCFLKWELRTFIVYMPESCCN